ncbi:non-ribosomal peptide synthetase [Micromonospora narathiwatensis]|uniref:Amino acid adenylation domain-containing protein n=1 Tax=Micromonospora narathiwatensis TaxID=299146 RepID=A0A1A8ZIS4_9ACTN|nr:non-ribosomal peptide synthetase [Micromonospora narathiwatensis]SBT43950.1 amino acid adenylation domain-containing protein [Micromonospora narathiwatensis]
MTNSEISGERLPYPERTLADLILSTAARRGDAVAVRQWDEVLSYAELAERATVLAVRLRRLGVGPETPVGICAERRPYLLVAVLGVLLAGGCYVPLDRGHPWRRRAEIVADAGIKVVVADQAGRDALSDVAVTLVDVPAAAVERAATAPAPVGPASCPAVPDNAAYVLYTSGSTGRPKGVVVSHRSVVAHVTAFGAHTGADERTRAFGFASLGFDASVQDLFIPLVAGGEIALVPDADRVDPARLQRFAEAHEVTWGCLPAALLPLLEPAELPHWRTVFTGVEAPDPAQVERWAGPADRSVRRFSNGYGPTEATVCVTSFTATGHWDRPLPMGRPLPNHRIHLVDQHGEQVPPGTPGEVLIGGVGVARGYLGRPGVTAERFVPDPYSAEPGARLYRTGDRAVQLPDGELLFLGRTDRQVKIRGQRVELGEIEHVVCAHAGVREAAVVAVGPDTRPELVAVLVPAGEPSDDDVLAYLRRRLPDVMVPRRVVQVPALPLNTAGKRDAARLREIATAGAGDQPATPGDAGAASDLDIVVADVWGRILGAPAGPDDDFFAAGGDSLTAMRLVATLRAELGREVAVEDVFDARTLGVLAARVAATAPLTEPELTVGHPPTLSPAQRRLWFLDQLAPDSAAYNTAMAERLRGPLDPATLRAALTAVVHRHDVLRWRITRVAGAPHVTCDPPGDVPLPVVDLSALDADRREAELRAGLQAGAATRFDLATGPVWRARLYRLADDEHVFAMAFHHAVFDGWSQAVFYDQLGAAYAAALAGDSAGDSAAAVLGSLPAGYADYAVWRTARDRARGEQDLAWWKEHLAGAPTVLELPADRVRPATQTYRGAFATTSFPPEVDTRVRGLAASLGTTSATVLLAAFGEVLRRLTGGADHVVGAVVADRRLAAVADLVGFFVDIVPVRLRTDPAGTFADHVRGCRQELLDVLAHPNAPLERIVQALAVPRDTTRSPLVQVLFNVFNFAEPALDLPKITTERVPAGLPGSPFDLTVYLVERGGVLALDAVYNPDLFAAERIAALLDGYLELLDLLAAGPESPIGVIGDHGTDDETAAASAAGSVGGALWRAARDAVQATGAPHRPPEPDSGAVPAGPSPSGAAAAPTGVTEELVARVWREALDAPRVQATDNFFDIGGHSLAMAVVQHRLAEALGREIPLVDLFRYPNVRALAAYLDGAAGVDGIDLAVQRATTRRERTRGRREARAANRVRGANNAD